MTVMFRTLVASLVLVAAVVLAGYPAIADGADGKAVYMGKCKSCHGPDGKAQTPVGQKMKASDLTKASAKSAADLKATIANGKGKMPAYKDKLGADEIDAVVQFVRTLK